MLLKIFLWKHRMEAPKIKKSSANKNNVHFLAVERDKQNISGVDRKFFYYWLFSHDLVFCQMSIWWEPPTVPMNLSTCFESGCSVTEWLLTLLTTKKFLWTLLVWKVEWMPNHSELAPTSTGVIYETPWKTSLTGKQNI